jgi:hypothetical protein
MYCLKYYSSISNIDYYDLLLNNKHITSHCDENNILGLCVHNDLKEVFIGTRFITTAASYANRATVKDYNIDNTLYEYIDKIKNYLCEGIIKVTYF